MNSFEAKIGLYFYYLNENFELYFNIFTDGVNLLYMIKMFIKMELQGLYQCKDVEISPQISVFLHYSELTNDHLLLTQACRIDFVIDRSNKCDKSELINSNADPTFDLRFASKENSFEVTQFTKPQQKELSKLSSVQVKQASLSLNMLVKIDDPPRGLVDEDGH